MRKWLYLVRHCQAAGQEAEAPLTAAGQAQALALAAVLAPLPITRIVASPYRRAQDTAAPLARQRHLAIETDARLVERRLTTIQPLPDWQQQLQASFRDLDRCLEGGESSRAAMQRGGAVVADALRAAAAHTALITHGNLLALLLKHFDDRRGFATWQQLTNPDVFRIAVQADGVQITRIWR